MRISRGNEVIGNRSAGQVKKGIADASLLLTDFYYDEELSEWLPLADYLTRVPVAKVSKHIGPPCYCGSNLPFQVCHGDGSLY
jgi:SEC-C motif